LSAVILAGIFFRERGVDLQLMVVPLIKIATKRSEKQAVRMTCFLRYTQRFFSLWIYPAHEPWES